MPLITNPPPPTPVDPVTEVLHGVSVTDPYRWLEDQDSPQTRKWLEAQTAYVHAYLDTIPGQERIRNRLKDLLTAETISQVCHMANRYFFLKRGALQEQPAILMRESQSEKDIILVDPAQRDQGSSISVNILGISRDGRILAYGVRDGGDDCQSIEFFDVDHRRVLPDRIPPGRYRGLAFTPDLRGFYYSHELAGRLRTLYRAVYWHGFGTQFEEDCEVFPVGVGRNLHVHVVGSIDDKHLGYYVMRGGDNTSIDFFAQDITRDRQPRLIVEDESMSFVPIFVGERLIAMTDWQAPNRRVVSIELDSPQRNNWREIISESSARIKNIAATDKYIIVNYDQHAGNRIEIFYRSGQKRCTLPCPPHGTTTLLSTAPEINSPLYSFSSFQRPPEIRQYHIESGREEVWARSQIPFDSSSIDVQHVSYDSKDGTRIPMFLLTDKRFATKHPQPTVIFGYGGFGTSVTPQFAAYATFLVEHGCLFAIPNLRGGGEFGQEWHLAGKRNNRQKVIDDFIASAEWLISKDYTARGRIGIVGGSNGGLLVGAALTQRPDLFCAAICIGPLLDMLRYHHFDSADMWIGEYGTAENANDFPSLQAYSPYHHVNDGVAYPAVLLVSGDADTRCNPMHARKMTARLQVASSSDRPILLDYKPSWGHWPAQPLSGRIEAVTKRLTFLCHELGLSY